MRRAEQERTEAIQRLRDWGIKPGDTIYCILRHVSASGMLRVIDLVYFVNGDVHDLRHIGYVAAQALGNIYDRKREGIRVSGCGMDMGFHLVYNLGRTLFPEGFAVEGRGRNGDTSGHDNDGGYALKHRWL